MILQVFRTNLRGVSFIDLNTVLHEAAALL